MALKAGVVGSITNLKKTLAKGSSSDLTVRIKDGQTLRGRFMAEPDKWVKYEEHFDKAHGYFPCIDDGTCLGCADGLRSNKRFLVHFVDYEEKKLIALVLPYTLAEDLAKKYDRFNTLLDRVYDLSRTGAGIKDTTYEVNYDERKAVDLSRFEADVRKMNLLELLESLVPSSEFVADDDDDDRPAPRQRRADLDDAPRPARRVSADRDQADLDDRPRTKVLAKKKLGALAKKIRPAADPVDPFDEEIDEPPF